MVKFIFTKQIKYSLLDILPHSSSIFFQVAEAFLKSKPHKAIQTKPKRDLLFMLKVQYATLLCITQTFILLRYYNVLENYSNF